MLRFRLVWRPGALVCSLNTIDLYLCYDSRSITLKDLLETNAVGLLNELIIGSASLDRHRTQAVAAALKIIGKLLVEKPGPGDFTDRDLASFLNGHMLAIMAHLVSCNIVPSKFYYPLPPSPMPDSISLYIYTAGHTIPG